MGPNEGSLDDRRRGAAGGYRAGSGGVGRHAKWWASPPTALAQRRVSRRGGQGMTFCATFDVHGDHRGPRATAARLGCTTSRRAGETIGVTDRGRLVAILAPASAATGAGALMAAGRVQPARRPPDDLPKPLPVDSGSDEILDELRSDR